MVVFLCNVLPQLPRAGELLVALFASVSVPRVYPELAGGGVAQVLVGVGGVERELGEKMFLPGKFMILSLKLGPKFLLEV